jgi:hypothetical protein
LISRNKYADLAELMQVKGDGSLQGIQGAKPFGCSVLNQQSSCAVKMTFRHQRRDREPLLGDREEITWQSALFP